MMVFETKQLEGGVAVFVENSVIIIIINFLGDGITDKINSYRWWVIYYWPNNLFSAVNVKDQ